MTRDPIRPWMMMAIFIVIAATARFAEAREPAFGDSTWVAPYAEITGTPEESGPRVAPRDHERAWETVLRAPFRVTFLPIRLMARGIESLGPLAQRFFPPGDLFRQSRPRTGLSFSPALLGGTVTARNFAGPGSKAALKLRYGITDTRKASLRGYVGEAHPWGAGWDLTYDRRPSRSFFGIGNESPSEKTHYMRRASLASAYLFTGRDHLRRLRVGGGISDMDAGPGYNGSPRSTDRFTSAEVPYLTDPSRMVWYGASAELGAMDDSLQPTSGFEVKPDVKRYVPAGGADLRYDQWRLEARGYLPVFAKWRVLAARLVYEGLDPRGGSGPIPFYRLPETVDADVFPGYPSGRFRDRRLALGQLEYRWEVERPVWAFLIGSMGEVASSTSALSLRSAHPALGGGLRAKLGSQLGRVEAERGHEGWDFQADISAEF